MNTEAQKLIDGLPRTVSAMLQAQGEAFYSWQSEKVSSGGYSSSVDERERFSRCHDASENGSDGSTHGENIDDFREYGHQLFEEAVRLLFRCDLTLEEDKAAEAAVLEASAAFDADVDSTEAWHEANGSLEQECG